MTSIWHHKLSETVRISCSNRQSANCKVSRYYSSLLYYLQDIGCFLPFIRPFFHQLMHL